MNEYVRMGVIDQFIASITKWKSYKELSQRKSGTVVRYVSILILLTTVMTALIPMLGFSISVGGYENFFKNQIPPFELKDGTFHIENKIDINLGAITYVADSNVEAYTKDDVDPTKIQQVFISKSNIAVYEFGRFFTISLEQLKGITLTNDTLVNFIPYIYVIEAICLFVIFLIQCGSFALSAFFYSLLGKLMCTSKKIELTFSQIFKISVYAKTLAVILDAGNQTMGYVIPAEYWYVISVTMTYVYLSFGIASHDTKKKTKIDNNQFN